MEAPTDPIDRLEVGADGVHRTFCRFCAARCGALVEVEDGWVVGVRGDHDHPMSHGYLCPKGRAIGTAQHDAARLDHPYIGRGAQRRQVTHAELVGSMSSELRRIIDEHGVDAVGMYVGTSAFSDKGGISAAYRLRDALGTRSFYTPYSTDALPKGVASKLVSGQLMLVPLPDMENTKLTLFIGCNPIVSHGHLWGMPDPVRVIRRLTAKGEVWVIDPRRSETAKLAGHHLAIRPGSDHALLGFLIRSLLESGADRKFLEEHAKNVDALQRSVERFDLLTTARIVDVPAEQVEELLASIRRVGRISLFTGTGTLFPDSGEVNEWLGFALLAVTGSLDRPGGMWFNPDFFACSDHAEVLGGGYFAAPGTTADEGAAEPSAVGPRPPSRPELPNWAGQYPCAALCDEIESGNLRALIVHGGNPLIALPDYERVERALRQLEVLIVADVMDADMSEVATHVLPCASQLERADISTAMTAPAVYGQYTPAVLPLIDDRRPTWWFFGALAAQLGYDILPCPIDECTDDVWLEIACATARATLGELKQEPLGILSETTVFGWITERILPGGRWDIGPASVVKRLGELADPPPFVLVPRRQLRHTNSTLRDVGAPGGHVDRSGVLMHELDLIELGLVDGQRVVVESRSGSVAGSVQIDPTLRRGMVAVPHGHQDTNVGRLTSSDSTGVVASTGMVIQSVIPVTVRAAELHD